MNARFLIARRRTRPQFRTTVTRPSAASTRTARAAVVRLTPYCSPIWLAGARVVVPPLMVVLHGRS